MGLSVGEAVGTLPNRIQNSSTKGLGIVSHKGCHAFDDQNFTTHVIVVGAGVGGRVGL